MTKCCIHVEWFELLVYTPWTHHCTEQVAHGRGHFLGKDDSCCCCCCCCDSTLAISINKCTVFSTLNCAAPSWGGTAGWSTWPSLLPLSSPFMATSSSAFTGIHYTAFIIINRLLYFGNLMNKFLTFYVVFKKFHDFVFPVKNCFELDLNTQPICVFRVWGWHLWNVKCTAILLMGRFRIRFFFRD